MSDQRPRFTVRPLGGAVGCLIMIAVSIVLSVVLTIALNVALHLF